MNALVDLLRQSEAAASLWFAALLVAARALPLTVIAPWMMVRMAPAVVRAGVVMALVVGLAPLVSSRLPAVLPDRDAMFVWLARELVIGAVYAVAVSLPLFALDWAGRLTDTWRGATLSEVIAPPTGERTSPLGDFYLMTGLALFVTLGGPRVALGAFADGLGVAPDAVALDVAQVAFGSLRPITQSLALALAFAAPAALAIVLVELSLGLVGRAAPQLPVFFAGMPLRAGSLLFVALLSISLIVARLPELFRSAQATAGALLAR